jgi:membrane glycosyltransferase
VRADASIAVTPALVRGGRGVLGNAQKNALLDDPFSLSQLHLQIWSSSPSLERWNKEVRLSDDGASLADAKGGAGP